MYGYEIPVNETAYAAKERYLNDKKQSEDRAKVRKEYTDFVSNSRDYFLVEAMNMILQESLDEETSTENREYGKALIEGFVKEKDSIKLLTEFSKKSLLLAGISNLVTESHQKVLHSCKEGDSKTFKITKTVDGEFFEKLIGLKDDKITAKINERVCDSIETFVQANVNDKLDLEELAGKTKEKIDGIKAKTEAERKRIEESFTLQYNRKVNEIKKRSHRKVGVYEQIMHSMTQSIVSDNDIRESFIAESGQLNVSKIQDKVTVMYTFLEMLNTTKMENVNEAYIEKLIKNI